MLNVILARGGRRRASNRVDSVQTTYRSVDNANSVQAAVDAGIEFEYNGRVYKVGYHQCTSMRTWFNAVLYAQAQPIPLTTQAPMVSTQRAQVRQLLFMYPTSHHLTNFPIACCTAGIFQRQCQWSHHWCRGGRWDCCGGSCHPGCSLLSTP